MFRFHREQRPFIHQPALQQPIIAATMPRWESSENIFIFHIFFSLRCQLLQALWNQQWQRSLPTNAAAARWEFIIQIINLKWGVGCFSNSHRCWVKPIFAMQNYQGCHLVFREYRYSKIILNYHWRIQSFIQILEEYRVSFKYQQILIPMQFWKILIKITEFQAKYC